MNEGSLTWWRDVYAVDMDAKVRDLQARLFAAEEKLARAEQMVTALTPTDEQEDLEARLSAAERKAMLWDRFSERWVPRDWYERAEAVVEALRLITRDTHGVQTLDASRLYVIFDALREFRRYEEGR